MQNKNVIFRAPVWRMACTTASGMIFHRKTRRI